MSFNEPVRGRCHFAENPAELFSAREISLNFDIALAASVTIENVISRTRTIHRAVMQRLAGIDSVRVLVTSFSEASTNFSLKISSSWDFPSKPSS